MGGAAVRGGGGVNAKQDYRIGLAVTPKLRQHKYFGHVGVVRQIFSASENIKELMAVQLFAASVKPLMLREATDDWKTA